MCVVTPRDLRSASQSRSVDGFLIWFTCIILTIQIFTISNLISINHSLIFQLLSLIFIDWFNNYYTILNTIVLRILNTLAQND